MYVVAYIGAYLGALGINLAVVALGSEVYSAAVCFVAAIALGTNIIGVVGLWSRRPWGIALERALSAGRMVCIVAASTVFSASLLFYSPTFHVIWKPLIEFGSGSLWRWWLACVVLFGFEVHFYRRVGDLDWTRS